MSEAQQLYLDDLHVGQRFQSGSYLMEAARIKEFAAEFDPQPFHLDQVAAEASIFRGLAASGWHTAAVAMRLLVAGGLPFADGIVGLGGEIAWPKPTRPGDTLQVESEIIEITPSRSKPQQGIVTVRSTMFNQDREAVYLLTAKLLVLRRPRGKYLRPIGRIRIWSIEGTLTNPMSSKFQAYAALVGRRGAYADRLRVLWTWARSLPDALDPATTGPLLSGGITVFAPLLQHALPSTARVGIIDIGGLGHMALQFANKWGCEVHAFTTSDSKETEARQLGAHYVHNSRKDGALKKLGRRLDLVISTINAPQDVSAFLDTLAPKRSFHNLVSVLKPLEVPAFGLILGQKSVAGSPTGSPTAIDHMLDFSARHSVAPVVEYFPMSN